jgi:hypothetical protein
MRHYRFYIVGSNNHFVGARDIECTDDQAAIREARLAVDGFDIEVWEADRFIVMVTRPSAYSCRVLAALR